VRRPLDLALVAALVVAVSLTVLGAVRDPVGALGLPLLAAGDPPGALHAPGAPARALQGRLATVGDVLTIEDLARGVLALEQGHLPGVAPLSPGDRAEVAKRLAEANARREALLALETRMAREDAALRAEAVALAATLTPEQRAWVASQRDIASVAGVERVYWDALLAVLDAPPSGLTTDAPTEGTPR
jgi:hypothetical protein